MASLNNLLCNRLILCISLSILSLLNLILIQIRKTFSHIIITLSVNSWADGSSRSFCTYGLLGKIVGFEIFIINQLFINNLIYFETWHFIIFAWLIYISLDLIGEIWMTLVISCNFLATCCWLWFKLRWNNFILLIICRWLL